MEMFFTIKYLFIVTVLVLLGDSTGINGQAGLTTLQSNLSQTQLADQCSENKQWFCFNSTTKAYNCSQVRSVLPEQTIECFESGPALPFGYCATYDEDTRILSLLPACGFFQYGLYNVTTAPGYIQLPTVLTDLSDYMCSPLHRKGLVCSKCTDNFGPSLTSYWHRCTNCTNAWYGIPLFLLIEFIPITVFYIFVVLFQIRLTAPPMPCFIMLAQLFHIGFKVLHPIGQMVPMIETKDGHIRLQDMRIAHLMYSMFNLDFFLSVLPPFCISSKLKFYHVILFGYISAFYPIVLIFLTWLCVELHGCNYRLLKWLWKPFKLCFARLKRRGVDTKSDLVDVFATFFLLSYHKCVYQTQMYYDTGLAFTFNIDPSGEHFSVHKGSVDGSYTTTYTCLFISVLCIAALFCLLPPILLICYPFKFFRSCLSKCRLDSLTVNIFVENFHGYYRNGLDGGRDMRSFSGFYFFLVIGICLLPLPSFKDFSFYFSKVTALVVAVTIALIKPYKKTYANVLDTLILTDLALISLWSDYNNGSSFNVRSILPRVLIIAPIVILITVLLFRMVCKAFQMICRIEVSPRQCYKFLCKHRSRRASQEELSESSQGLRAATAAEQPL